MTKNELRISYKQKRLSITSQQKNKLEDIILIQFQRLNIEIPANIMTYAPFGKFNEFDPQLITDYCLFKNPDQVLSYSVVDGDSNDMRAVIVEEDSIFVKNRYGIGEPESGEEMPVGEIDLVIVPMLAFDVNGHRVGYGKGYYDRFLKRCREDVIRIGFSFFEAEQPIDDTDEWDVPLDFCITPETIYEF
ncbi:5-formyltetrahydrofolate cyclo-ligase [Ferruginibacter sp. HRS2-29]|uniref:5-formyltetrahydrofolate cyclo-ligase n=1 Tax=Ferruginibacter sp. HRS2-29 TaxID=2487334 RepID=UPI0020CE7D5D|nr:5-formyltetrahydrofolate cyclo-ligase [Ferruginibacter sp. HRS2-29]MCP9752054.1 5-formyltetrahydrofolate cyclo-ligase [Ferruginibacter sp. HRS2-29]